MKQEEKIKKDLQANGYACVKSNTRNLIVILASVADELGTKLCLERVGEYRLVFLYKHIFYKEKASYLDYISNECVGSDSEDLHNIVPMTFDKWMNDNYIIVW